MMNPDIVPDFCVFGSFGCFSFAAARRAWKACGQSFMVLFSGFGLGLPSSSTFCISAVLFCSRHRPSRWIACKRGRSGFTGRSGSDAVGFGSDFGIPNARFGPVPASPALCGPHADTKPSGGLAQSRSHRSRPMLCVIVAIVTAALARARPTVRIMFQATVSRGRQDSGGIAAGRVAASSCRFCIFEAAPDPIRLRSRRCGKHEKPVDNPFLRCIWVSGSGLGLTTLPTLSAFGVRPWFVALCFATAQRGFFIYGSFWFGPWKCGQSFPALSAVRRFGLGLSTFPQPHPASALGPAVRHPVCAARAGGIFTRRWRSRRACGRRRRRPINFPLLTRRPFRMRLWFGFAASAARRSSTRPRIQGFRGAVADSTSGIRRFKRGLAGGRI